MPSTSGFSDVMLDRIIISRNELYFGRYDPLASSSIVEANSRDLCAIGSLFPLNPKQGSWPKVIEITEDEGIYQSSNMVFNPPEVPHDHPRGHNDSLPMSPPPTPRHTPPRAVGYVSPSEFSKLFGEQSNNDKALSDFGQSSEGLPTPPQGHSPCTTVYGGDDERVLNRQSQPRTPASTRHTPSHRSFGTTEDENGRIGEPTSPPPWSPYDQKSDNNKDDKKE